MSYKAMEKPAPSLFFRELVQLGLSRESVIPIYLNGYTFDAAMSTVSPEGMISRERSEETRIESPQKSLLFDEIEPHRGVQYHVRAILRFAALCCSYDIFDDGCNLLGILGKHTDASV